MQIILVYNAEAGLLNGAKDSLHKLLSPATYPCSLCALTYGLFAMDRRWRDYLGRLPHATIFHHKSDFRAAYPQLADIALPAILCEDGQGIEPLLDAAKLNELTDVNALIAALDMAIGIRR